MCYLYPQVYNDGCEVKVTPKKTSCVPCAEHARLYQVTRQPCHKGRVVISTFGLCPEHEQLPPPPHHDDDEQGHQHMAGAIAGGDEQQRHQSRQHQSLGQRRRAHTGPRAHAHDGGPSGSWFDVDVNDDDDGDSDTSSRKSRGSSSSTTSTLWGGWMAKVWGTK